MNKIALGGIFGGILGVPGSYFFQSELARSKFGGIGGYLQKIPEFFDESAWELGIPQNFFLGIVVIAIVGAFLGFLFDKITMKK